MPETREAKQLPGGVIRYDPRSMTDWRGDAVPFPGFPDPDGTFFHELATRQSREWFQANRTRYEEQYLAPLKALLNELAPRIEGLFPGRTVSSPRVFRINRDVRFSPDKSPYKTHIGGWLGFEQPEMTAPLPAVVYVQLGMETFVGAGHYVLDPGQLTRFRSAIADDHAGGELAAILARLREQGHLPDGHDVLKRVPRGFDPGHPRADLLKWKALTVRFPQPPREVVASASFVDWAADRTREAAPLITWLADVTG